MPKADRTSRQAELDLLKRFQHEDPAACQELMTCARRVANSGKFRRVRHQRDDLVQEAMAQLWRRTTRPGFTLQSSLRALLAQITAARCIDALRKLRQVTQLTTDMRDTKDGPDRLLEHREVRESLERALAQLPSRDRLIFQKSFYEDKSSREIGEELDVPEGTIRFRLHAGRKRLSELLRRDRDSRPVDEPGSTTTRGWQQQSM
jgi:RNA polymerase sigma-70 factor (ECF subfamily)